MAKLEIDSDNSLFYEYEPPTSGYCYVFFNALIGDTAMWEAEIAPALRQKGHGTLLWNYRGQRDSAAGQTVQFTDSLISGDAASLLSAVNPPKPLLVGLSIGGLFAAQQWLHSGVGVGMTLINTLREPGPRLDWINQASFEAARIGGLDLVKNLFSPLIFNREWLAENYDNAFQSSELIGLQAHQGHFRLLNDARTADWNLPYERLTLPIQVLTGLQDNLFFEPEAVDRLVGRLTNVRRVDLADAGHMVPVERPQALIAALLKFADELG